LGVFFFLGGGGWGGGGGGGGGARGPGGGPEGFGIAASGDEVWDLGLLGLSVFENLGVRGVVVHGYAVHLVWVEIVVDCGLVEVSDDFGSVQGVQIFRVVIEIVRSDIVAHFLGDIFDFEFSPLVLQAVFDQFVFLVRDLNLEVSDPLLVLL
jgi:hypothetical protein